MRLRRHTPRLPGGRTLGTAAPPAVVTDQFITRFGEHSVGGIWKVRVPREARTVEVGAYGASMQPGGWRAQDGWFVLVENDRRVWAYDGDLDLLLFDATKNPEGGPAGSVGSLEGPTKFNCPVPETVLTRIPMPHGKPSGEMIERLTLERKSCDPL